MNPFQMAMATLAIALLLDCLHGEYPAAPHPVVWIGKLISLLLKAAPASGWWRQLIFGMFLAVTVPSLAAALTIAALRLASGFGPLALIVGAFLLKASFALRELGAAAERVRGPVVLGDLPRAREALRALCSRDPSALDEDALIGATVESLAENLSDSYVAPLFYFVILGIPGALAYRAINTLDAMIGYRGSYEALGKASARLDDLANIVPARLTAVLLLLSGCLTGRDVIGGWRIFWRDRAKTPSPNGGRPMAIMAGLLGVQLEKKGVYTLGDPKRPLMPATVTQAWRLVVLTGWIAAALAMFGVWVMGMS
jgi:adenosylcobinamide-phosphate synthase